MKEIAILDENELKEELFQIPNPPKKIYIRGSFPDKTKYKFLTIVGSRNYSTYGKEVVEHLIQGLKDLPVVIVSGLAIGIDTIAHSEAIKVGLKTIAIPGSGLDESVIYPRNNVSLAEKIIEEGGCLLSEYEPKTKSAIWTFPARNRLMAGLSDAVLIIEAEEKSGTLITAKLALDYNKTVLCVPGSIFSQSSKGTNYLIKEGATPITCREDVLEALNLEKEFSLDVKERSLFDTLSKEEKDILEKLQSPKTKDELIRTTNMETNALITLLMVMELKGLLKEEFGEIKRKW